MGRAGGGGGGGGGWGGGGEREGHKCDSTCGALCEMSGGVSFICVVEGLE